MSLKCFPENKWKISSELNTTWQNLVTPCKIVSFTFELKRKLCKETCGLFPQIWLSCDCGCPYVKQSAKWKCLDEENKRSHDISTAPGWVKTPWPSRQLLCLTACGTPSQSKAYTRCLRVSPHSSASRTLCTSWWRKNMYINLHQCMWPLGRSFISIYLWYWPVVMPQLSVTSNQVDPLAHGRFFFFKCKNVDSLWKEKQRLACSPHTHTELTLTDEAVIVLPLCSPEQNWWPDSDEERTSRSRTADTATVEACSVR